MRKQVRELILNCRGNKLDLGACGLHDNDMEELCKLLMQNKNIIIIDLSSNNISDKGVKYLANCQHIQMIYLHANNVGDEGLLSLLSIQALHFLSLDRNDLSLEGGKLLVEKSSAYFHVTAFGNPGIDSVLIEAISEKSKDYTVKEAKKRVQSQIISVANNPFASFSEANGAHLPKEKNSKELQNATLKGNGHKKITPPRS